METRNEQHGEPLVLVVPPVLHPMMPPLGANLLAPSCIRAGVATRVVEANLGFAARIGFHACGQIAASPPFRLIGEALFLAAAFPERAPEHPRILERLRKESGPGTIAMRWQAEPLSDALIARCLREIPDFIADTAREIVACGARIVGMSTMGQQTLASIALARAIKRLDPGIVTVIGGSNATEPMGTGILACSDVFDFAFSGEADIELPKFCRAYLDSGELPARRVINCLPVQDMDSLPEPVYDAYFAALEPLRTTDPMARHAPNSLLFESSRGCWWGDKRLCKFCGYIPPAVGRYRMRSPEKIVDAIEHLIERYGIRHIRASDAIMPAQFPKTVLPRLIERGVECTLAYEIKSNHREDDLDLCVRAGINELQPGIETLSSHVLTLMDKGVTALENVRLLRNCRSRNINVIWNFLSAFPGETPEDYREMMRLIPLIEHLRAPVRYGPIHISRYSPYQQDPAAYGIEHLRAMPVYVELFGEQADNVCSNFDADYATEVTSDEALTRAFEAVVCHWTDAWESGGDPPCLELHPIEQDWALVKDTRVVAQARWQLLERPAIDALNAVRDSVRADLIDPAQRPEIERLASSGLVVSYEGRFMSLVAEPAIGLRLHSERARRLAKASQGRAAAAPVAALR
jgi:ribosomal peptide maturation radical SAM protein 1